jgi:maltooligosyltrehalose trehalohydrolase
MAIGTAKNEWWADVLENGPSSRYAGYFDVEWAPPEARLRNIVLIPVLGEHCGRLLDAGELIVRRDGAGFQVCYADHQYPLDLRSVRGLIRAAASGCRSETMAFIGDALAELPRPTASDRAGVHRRHGDKAVLRRVLQRLLEEEAACARALDEVVTHLNAHRDRLHEILEAQSYLGYRRFFDINIMIGLRVDDPHVTKATLSTVPSPITHRLGAAIENRTTTFRVWAPERNSVELIVCAPPAASRAQPGDPNIVREVHPLTRDRDGYWTGRRTNLGAGTLYKFRLDGRAEETFPDPASRYQPYGVHGPSAVVDPTFRWTDGSWTAPAFDRLVIYELHVGTFSREGTFRGVMDRLGELAELGVTAIELMPVGDFAGERNWGYDGVALFAPARCYGTPDDLRALVDAAHTHGLAVFMDVVYNHFGPDGAYANAFSPYYFTDAHQSPWGRGVNLDGPQSAPVRRLFIENALHWVDEYHVDGLRLDATHALVDESERHFLAELTSTVRGQVRRPVYFVAEDHRNLATLLQPADAGGFGVDGVWADDFHHQARVHTAHDQEGYYADFSGTVVDLARTLEDGWFFSGQHSGHMGHARGTDPTPVAPRQFVICIQNHDQIGNRSDGARLNHQVDLAVFRALSALLLLAPQTPLLFMGQEWATRSPFLFFTDFNQALGQKITEGRRQEFKSFAAFADAEARQRIPDPQSADTFFSSRLDWNEMMDPPHAAMRRLYTRLLACRREADVLQQRPRGTYRVRALDDHTLALNYRDGRLLVVARLGGHGADITCDASPQASVVLTTEDEDVADAPQPIVIRVEEGKIGLRFRRPGAAVLMVDPV